MKRRLRGLLITLLSGCALAFLMFFPRTLDFGVGLGAVLTVCFLLGLLDAFGAIEILDASPPGKPRPAFDLASAPWMLRAVSSFNVRLLYLALGLFVGAACRFSVMGTMAAGAPWSGPLLIGLGVFTLAAARLTRPKRFDGDFHEGFLILSLSTASVMATLGSQGLWDCWETHYGEVARRQLEQDDWIGLFWEDNWFFSKPILIFWMMNLGMALFGVRVAPDEISPHAEWGVRFLVAVLAIAVVMGVYQLLARRISRRAGVFAAVVLLTMPLYAFMARQAVTDLPFVGFMTLAVILFMLGITAQRDERVGGIDVPIRPGRRLRLDGFHLTIAGYVLCAVPQFLYLATRSASFRFGTLGRDDLKVVKSKITFLDGRLSDAVSRVFGADVGGITDVSLDWFMVGIAYLTTFLVILYTLRKERRISRLCFHGMYLMLALSVMAKGLAGLVFPILGFFGLWAVLSPWKTLLGKGGLSRYVAWHWDKLGRLDVLRGGLMFLLVASPWYVAMTLRHGMAFINRFFIHDHIKRLSVGVHGDTGSFDYFVQQIGYGAFPWVALIPFALLAWMTTGSQVLPTNDEAARSRRLILIFTSCWAVLSFGFLSMMATKFHHYVFPLIPPTAILVGIYLDDIWKGRVASMGPAIMVGLVVLALVTRDLIAPAGKGVLSGYSQLVGLFVYKYARHCPTGAEYDVSKELLVFALLLAATLALWIPERVRRVGVVLTLLVALVFGHWLTQHHMVALAPHWTQKHLVEEYYQRRTSPAERLVAFQMNWKGENFYTGNRVVVHVSTKNKNFEKWVDKHRGERHFFITEHGRFNRMSSRADAASGPLEPFADTCNKYKAGWADKL